MYLQLKTDTLSEFFQTNTFKNGKQKETVSQTNSSKTNPKGTRKMFDSGKLDYYSKQL